MKQHIRNNLNIYIGVFFLTLIVFSYYLIGNRGILLFYGDPFEINYKLWQGGWEAVRTGTFGQFTWSLGLGANTFSYIFYFLSNPFFWISCLLPKEFILYSFLIFQIINITIGFIAIDCWLYKVVGNRIPSIIGSLIISFSGYMFFYLQADQFEKLFILYPMILYFVECYLQNNKWELLVPSIALLGLSHYYLLYLFIPFLSIYTILRYIMLQDHFDFTKFAKSALLFSCYVTLGILISSVILVPCGYLILNMPRFSSKVDIPVLLTLKQIWKITTSLFFPVGEKLNANPIFSSKFTEFYGWSGGCSLYSFILTPLLLPYLFKIKSKIEKRCYIIFSSLLIIFIVFPIFSYIFQFTIDTRWYYMFVFLNGLIVTKVLSEIDNKKIIINKSIYFHYIFITFVYFLAFILAGKFKITTKKSFLQSIIVSIFLLAVLYLYTNSLLKKKKTYSIIPILCIEIIASAIFFSINNIPIIYWAFEDQIFHTRISESLKEIEKNDNSFYRVMYNNKTIVVKEHIDKEDDTFTMMTGNEPYSNGYAGFGFYESVYNTNQEDFLERMKSTWNMTQMLGRTRTHNMLSAKYWYCFKNSDNRPVPYGYEKIFSNQQTGLEIYENKNYIELGYTYQKTINSEYLKSLPYFEQDRIMTEYLAVDESKNESYILNDSIQHLETLPASDQRIYKFEQPIKNVQLYIENYGLPNAKIRTYRNGTQINFYDIWQFHYIDFPIYNEIDEIRINAPALYGNQTEINLYMEPFESQYNHTWKTQTKTYFENVQKKNDLITADITISTEKEYVFTSIPFDKGWTVFVDDKPIKYQKVQLGFIGFQLENGTHTIKFKYQTPGLKLGLIISLSSIMFYIVLIIANFLKPKYF